ncbi:hypothetical protein BI364_14385 [Acidihalobacter yilgarnensis]|uniref:histidine kinase n=1 Tax=Acidihalobacter yilgarnensis TaxID=2819280 RepID=A0A1D8IR58_9GAMM|nr:HAMP domain-containing sensor histidine kinase [Acidihalobacter yilgarnensis]AOU98982.1 hypothetical protein BI364_14385 [Acidihalobacter yilgarnensis]
MPKIERTGEERQSWQPLRLFNLYRLFVAALFLALWRFGLAPQSLGHLSPGLFFITLLVYLGLGLIALVTARLRWPSFQLQANLLATGDVLAVTLLAHSSGGVTSGVEVLLIPAIGAAGLLLSELSALFAAAAASLLLLFDQIYLHLSGLQEQTAYTQIRLINDAAWQLMGHVSGAHLDALERLSPALFTLFRQWQSNPDALHRTLALPGQGLELRIRFTPLGLDRQATLIMLEDQAELAAQVQSAKLASLGRLAASIAHEIRNPLSAISHAAQLLRESPSLNAQDTRLVEIIRTQGARMDAIVDDVLRLSRKDPPRTRPLDLKIWLQTQASEVRTRLGEDGAELRLHLDDTNLVAICDEGHLAQIFWSLCENASRYGRRKSDGRLLLTFAAHRPPGAQQIRMDVIDQGSGVPPEVIAHLFEPFFTTSASGTGLGLYIASELCALNGGHLEYIPVPSGGSCFRCFLPAVRRSAASA